MFHEFLDVFVGFACESEEQPGVELVFSLLRWAPVIFFQHGPLPVHFVSAPWTVS